MTEKLEWRMVFLLFQLQISAVDGAWLHQRVCFCAISSMAMAKHLAFGADLVNERKIFQQCAAHRPEIKQCNSKWRRMKLWHFIFFY